MKWLSLLLLAASSLLWSASALAEERPHYGGSLRVEMREAPQNLDPVVDATPGVRSLSGLIFETLVTVDDHGRPQPLLATSWQAEPGNQRWRFQLHSGVLFSDGTVLDAGVVAAALRDSNPSWKIVVAGDALIIETETPDPELPAELALARRSIVRRSNGGLVGTGPFTNRELNPGKHIVLGANDEYWGGRPFVDSIAVELGKNDREQMIDFDLGKVDVIEVAPESIRRARAENREVIVSDASELMALVFTAEPHSDEEVHARNLLASTIDKIALNEVVLQGGGAPADALLPNWASGYEFVFGSSGLNRSSVHAPQQKINQTWKVSFDVSDPAAGIIAQRLALNARDAGMHLDLSSAGTADLRLMRVALQSSEPHVALMELARTLQLADPKFTSMSVAELYAAERTLLRSQRVIPLLHLQSAVALRPAVQAFSISPDARWHLQTVWLSAEKP